MPEAGAGAAEDVVPLWLLLDLGDGAVRLGVAAAGVVLVVLVLRGLLGR